jgi:hypothetical protein
MLVEPPAPAVRTERGARPTAIVAGGLGLVVAGTLLGLAAASWDLSPSKHRTTGGAASSTATVSAAATTSTPMPSTSAASSSAPVASAGARDDEPVDAAVHEAAAPSALAREEKVALGATVGRVKLPRSALGHRIFVDGRLAASDVEALVLPCGHHDIRVGSAGATRSIDVPCGEEIDLR